MVPWVDQIFGAAGAYVSMCQLQNVLPSLLESWSRYFYLFNQHFEKEKKKMEGKETRE